MPKIRGQSLAEHRATTRAALFRAMAELIRERGFDGATLAEIAQRAGVGRTAIYNYFPDKESMMLGFIEEETGRYLQGLRADLAGIEDPVEQLASYARGLLHLRHDDLDLPAAATLRDVMSADARLRLREHVGSVELMLRDILRRCVADGSAPPQDLDVTVGLVHSAVTGRPLPRETDRRAAQVEAVVAFVLGGVGVREPGRSSSPDRAATA